MTVDIELNRRADPAVWTAADHELSEAAVRSMRDAVPENTRRAYTRVWSTFTVWCDEHGRTNCPATPATLAEYARHLADLDRAPATIEQAIAAIRTHHRIAGYGKGYPDAEPALMVLKDHRRTRAADGRGNQRQALPVRVAELRRMVDTIDTTTTRGIRDHALLLLGIVMFGRRSEIAALDWSDITGAGEGMVVRIRMSKTDQDARGETVPVLHGSFPGTDPVAVLERWRGLLADHGITDGPVLRRVSRGGQLLPSRVAHGTVNRIVQDLAHKAGLPPGFSAHSLRAGAATIAYKNGAPLSTICRLGRWKLGSRAVLGYIREVEQWNDHPFRGVL